MDLVRFSNPSIELVEDILAYASLNCHIVSEYSFAKENRNAKSSNHHEDQSAS